MLHGWIILDKPRRAWLDHRGQRGQAHPARSRRTEDQGRPRRHARSAGERCAADRARRSDQARRPDARRDQGYDFTIRFGEETDTLDAEGEVVATSDVRPTREQIEAVLPRFTGEIEQVPPAYSALKIGGKAAYARARAGEQVRMKSRGRSPSHSIFRRSAHSTTAGIDAETGRNHSVCDRLQGHLHPQPRPRHRPCAWNGRPRFLSKTYPRRALLPRTGHFTGLSGGSR